MILIVVVIIAWDFYLPYGIKKSCLATLALTEDDFELFLPSYSNSKSTRIYFLQHGVCNLDFSWDPWHYRKRKKICKNRFVNSSSLKKILTWFSDRSPPLLHILGFQIVSTILDASDATNIVHCRFPYQRTYQNMEIGQRHIPIIHIMYTVGIWKVTKAMFILA